jgi:hypothetical protein
LRIALGGVSVASVAARQTRAGFLGTGAAAIGGAALAGAWRVPSALGASEAAAATSSTVFVEGAFDPRFAGDLFSIEMNGGNAGWVKGVSGGEAYADVVTEKLGSDHIVHKHLAGVKYEDVSVDCQIGMSKGFYEWVKASFDKSPLRVTGSVVGSSKGLKLKSSGDFTNALISEIGFPALDASSKDAAKMTIKFRPEATSVRPRQGKTGFPGPPANLHGNWKIEIDGIDTRRVSGVDAFTVKQDFVDGGDAGSKFQLEPTSLEIPNLAVYTTPDAVQDWIDWFQDFVVAGNNGQDKERNGSLIFFDTGGAEVATVGLSKVGIFKLTPEKVEAGNETIRRVKAELYCEDMTFKFGTATWA